MRVLGVFQITLTALYHIVQPCHSEVRKTSGTTSTTRGVHPRDKRLTFGTFGEKFQSQEFAFWSTFQSEPSKYDIWKNFQSETGQMRHFCLMKVWVGIYYLDIIYLHTHIPQIHIYLI